MDYALFLKNRGTNHLSQCKRVPTYQSGVETRQPFADDRHSPPMQKSGIFDSDPLILLWRPRHSERPQRREAVYITHLLRHCHRRHRRIVDCSHQSLSCRTRGIRVMSIDTNSWGWRKYDENSNQHFVREGCIEELSNNQLAKRERMTIAMYGSHQLDIPLIRWKNFVVM